MIKNGKTIIAFDGDHLMLDDGAHQYKVPLSEIWYLTTVTNNLRAISNHKDFPTLFKELAPDKNLDAWKEQLNKIADSISIGPSDPKTIMETDTTTKHIPTDAESWHRARQIGKSIYDAVSRQVKAHKGLRGRIEHLERIWKNQKSESQFIFIHAGLDILNDFMKLGILNIDEKDLDTIQLEVMDAKSAAS